MLSNEHRTIIKATVPLLESGGEALTRHFYELMLREYPEVRPLFNQANQAGGTQQRALANAVLMYARHIDQLEQLGGLVSQIVNKHVSLQIQPEHYPIVGTCLLRAIREVLGAEIATDAVIEAWGAAYQMLAGILMGAEKQVYDQTAAAPGGWRGARAFTVTRKVRESDEITSFYLSPADRGEVLAFHPGQYIGLRVWIDGVEHRRNYSLSAASGDARSYRISVKRESNGTVSKYLHDRAEAGTTLDLFAPAGDFTLEHTERPLVLISGGVGITPTLAMLEAALKTKRRVHFIHAARHGGVHAFRDWIDGLAERHPQLKRFYCYAEHHGDHPQPDAVGLLDESTLASWMPETRDVDVYYLGPLPFMKAVRRHLHALGVPRERSRFEFFGPAAALE
jgi:nitric oxide dioxygenase